MIRRLAIVLTGVVAAAALATASATAAPADGPHPDTLTPKEQAGLHFAGTLVGGLLGTAPHGTGHSPGAW